MSCIYHTRTLSFSGFDIHFHLKLCLLASPAHLLFITGLFLGQLRDIRLSEGLTRTCTVLVWPGTLRGASSRKQRAGGSATHRRSAWAELAPGGFGGEQSHLNTCGLRLQQVKSLIYSPLMPHLHRFMSEWE